MIIGISACGTGTEKNDSTDPEASSDSGSVDTRIAELDAEISNDPENAELYYERARVYVKERDLNRAVTDIQKAISIDSTDARYFAVLGDIFYAGSKIYNARDALMRSVELDGQVVEPRVRLAEIYLILKEHRSSVLMLNEVIELDPDNLTAFFMRGMNYKEAGDTLNAVADFQKVVELDQEYYDAHMQLGVIMQSGNDPSALAYFNNCLILRPAAEEALYGRALWYQEHDELNKAIQDYTSIITINPANKNAHFNLGYIHHVLLQVYDSAIEHYSNALQADPQYLEAYYNRGLCYESLGNVDAAFADYQAAAALRPGYLPAEEGMKRVGG